MRGLPFPRRWDEIVRECNVGGTFQHRLRCLICLTDWVTARTHLTPGDLLRLRSWRTCVLSFEGVAAVRVQGHTHTIDWGGGTSSYMACFPRKGSAFVARRCGGFPWLNHI